MTTTTWIVGPEYDQAVFERLREALFDLGYALSGLWWGVGGSQEISRWSALRKDGEIIVEAETFIGLSVEGPAAMVAELRQKYGAVLH